MNSYRFFRFIALIGVMVICFSSLSLAGDPVPGIDVALEQIPGGLVKTAKTGKNGEFTFDNLKPGKYLVRLVPTKVENHNSSRSNKTYPIAHPGETEVSISITLIKTGAKKPFNPIEVIIKEKAGRITGRVDLEVGVKEEGVKS